MSTFLSTSRVRRHAAVAFVAAGVLSFGCQSPLRPGATTRLNLPNSIEPPQNAPKRYRPQRKIDPDYLKHPARWVKRLKSRYA